MRKKLDKIKKDKEVAENINIPKELNIHYIKSGCYRTFHVDGIFGGITPSGKIHAAAFIERQVLPEIVRQEVKSDGMLGSEVSRVTKQGITREIESGLIMDISVAKTFRDWLDKKIEEFEKVSKAKK
jgi:hypothetical protein